MPEGKASRIVLRKDLDPSNQDNWEDCFQWYVESVEKFRVAFVPRIRKFSP